MPVPCKMFSTAYGRNLWIFPAGWIANIEFFLYNNQNSGKMFFLPDAGADNFPLSIFNVQLIYSAPCGSIYH